MIKLFPLSPLRLPSARSSTNSRAQRWKSTKKAGSIPGQARTQRTSIIQQSHQYFITSVLKKFWRPIITFLTFSLSFCQVPSAVAVHAKALLRLGGRWGPSPRCELVRFYRLLQLNTLLVADNWKPKEATNQFNPWVVLRDCGIQDRRSPWWRYPVPTLNEGRKKKPSESR